MNLNITKINSSEYQAILQVSGIDICGPGRGIETPVAAVEALADMFLSWTEEIPATLPAHKGWLSIAAALKARVALSETQDPSVSS